MISKARASYVIKNTQQDNCPNVTAPISFPPNIRAHPYKNALGTAHCMAQAPNPIVNGSGRGESHAKAKQDNGPPQIALTSGARNCISVEPIRSSDKPRWAIGVKHRIIMDQTIQCAHRQLIVHVRRRLNCSNDGLRHRTGRSKAKLSRALIGNLIHDHQLIKKRNYAVI